MTKRGYRPRKPSPTDWDMIRENAARFAKRVEDARAGRSGVWPSNPTQNALYREHVASLRRPKRKPTERRDTSYNPIPVDQMRKGPMIVAGIVGPHQRKRAERWLRRNEGKRITPPNHIATAIKNAGL